MSPSKVEPLRNPKSLPPMFANRFLRALTIISFTKRSTNVLARARRIKRAADISLASAAVACNPKLAWSRAVLRRSRSVMHRHRQIRFRQKIGSAATEETRGSQAALLGRLVPGGEGLDFCGLLEEAADYIKSLKAQVQEETVETSKSHGKKSGLNLMGGTGNRGQFPGKAVGK